MILLEHSIKPRQKSIGLLLFKNSPHCLYVQYSPVKCLVFITQHNTVQQIVCNRAPQNNFLPLSNIYFFILNFLCIVIVRNFSLPYYSIIYIYIFFTHFRCNEKIHVLIYYVSIILLLWLKKISLTETSVCGRHFFYVTEAFFFNRFFFCGRNVFLWQTLKPKVVTVMEMNFLNIFFLSERNLFLGYNVFSLTEICFCLGKFFCHSNLFFVTDTCYVKKILFRVFYMWFQGESGSV